MNYRTKPRRVRAVQWRGTAHKLRGVSKYRMHDRERTPIPNKGWVGDLRESIEAGDWIVTDGKTKTILTNREFRKRYEPETL